MVCQKVNLAENGTGMGKSRALEELRRGLSFLFRGVVGEHLGVHHPQLRKYQSRIRAKSNSVTYRISPLGIDVILLPRILLALFGRSHDVSQ